MTNPTVNYQWCDHQNHNYRNGTSLVRVSKQPHGSPWRTTTIVATGIVIIATVTATTIQVTARPPESTSQKQLAGTTISSNGRSRRRLLSNLSWRNSIVGISKQSTATQRTTTVPLAVSITGDHYPTINTRPRIIIIIIRGSFHSTAAATSYDRSYNDDDYYWQGNVTITTDKETSLDTTDSAQQIRWGPGQRLITYTSTPTISILSSSSSRNNNNKWINYDRCSVT